MNPSTPQTTASRNLASPPRTLPAGFFSRTLAFIIDLVILNIIQFATPIFVQGFLDFFRFIGWVERIIIFLENPTYKLVIFTSVSVLLVFIYFLFFWTLVGFTPGKAILGLKIVRKDGAKLSFARAVVRFLAYWVSALPFFLGFFWVLWDANNRGWHDKIAGTQVLYIPKNPHP